EVVPERVAAEVLLDRAVGIERLVGGLAVNGPGGEPTARRDRVDGRGRGAACGRTELGDVAACVEDVAGGRARRAGRGGVRVHGGGDQPVVGVVPVAARGAGRPGGRGVRAGVAVGVVGVGVGAQGGVAGCGGLAGDPVGVVVGDLRGHPVAPVDGLHAVEGV